MAIIEKKAIISPEAEQPFDNLIKQYDILIAKNKELVSSSTTLQKAFVQVSQAQTSDGTEAKKLVEINEKLIKNNTDLTALQKQRVKVEEQINQVFVKNLAAKEKDALILEKGKQRLSENNRLLKEQAKEALGLTGAYERLTRKTLEAQKNFKQLAAEFGVNSKQAKTAKQEFQKLETQLSTVNKAARDGKPFVGRYSDALKGFGKQFIGALGLTALVSKFVSVIKNAAQIFISFDKNASKLAAILGKTKNEIKALTEQAKVLGATTAYTASQVLAGGTELAKLGFTSKQIENAIPGILSLAAATGTDLAPAAELAAATLRIFNLDASESGRVSDVLAKSTTISSLSMEKLATIMPTVGKTAQLAGVSLERTAALAGTLTDRGLDASVAATSLRNIFQELSNKGLTWEQAMKKINSSTDKNKTAMDLFGKRAAAAGAILAETGATTDELTKSLEKSKGAAEEMAKTMLDNLAGDMTIAQSAWEGFILSLEDGNGIISRVLRGATQWFTGLLEQLTYLNNESYKTAKIVKDNAGITDITAKALEKQKKYLESITDLEERKKAANERRLKLEALINQESLNALRAKEKVEKLEKEGYPLRAQIAKQEVAAAAIKIDSFKELYDQTIQYIPELQKVNEAESTNSEIVTTQTELTKKQTSALAKKNRERERELKLINDKLIKAEGKSAANVKEDVLSEIIPPELKPDITDAGAQAEIDFEIAKQEEIEEAKLAIKNAAVDAAVDYAKSATNSIVDHNLAKKQSEIEAEKDLLKNQLDKGLISETAYNQKIKDLNNKSRVEEAKAEKKKALFDIAIATAVAVVKSLPNIYKIAAAVAIGGIQAALVAARPIPKFAKGTKSVPRGNNPIGTDTIPAMVNEGERIIPTELNKKIGNIENEEIPSLINKGLIFEQTLNKKPDYNGLIYKQLGRLNKTNEQILQANENAVYQYSDNGVTFTVFANGRKKIKFGNERG